MRKTITVKNGRFVLTEYGFEQFKVRMLLAKDDRTVPEEWIENGYVVFVKEER